MAQVVVDDAAVETVVAEEAMEPTAETAETAVADAKVVMTARLHSTLATPRPLRPHLLPGYHLSTTSWRRPRKTTNQWRLR